MTFERSKKVKTANGRKFDLQMSKMKLFISNAILLKFCHKLLTVTQNKHTKFEEDRFSRLGVKAVSVSQKRPMLHNGRPDLTKFQSLQPFISKDCMPIASKLAP